MPLVTPHERAAACRALIRQRRLIGDALGFTLCPSPEWDMLLQLYLAECEGRSSHVWPIAVASNIPPTSASRKIAKLVAAGILRRRADDEDHRRSEIDLSAEMRHRLDALIQLIAGS